MLNFKETFQIYSLNVSFKVCFIILALAAEFSPNPETISSTLTDIVLDIPDYLHHQMKEF